MYVKTSLRISYRTRTNRWNQSCVARLTSFETNYRLWVNEDINAYK